MRPIRFRGRRVDNGEYIYGDFVHSVPQSSFPGIVDDDGFVHEVKPDSVAQLVGYDANGKEVYEGDIVEGVDEEWVAVLMSDILHNREDIREAPLKFLTLKEQPA